MSVTTFSFPTPTVFGPGARHEIPHWLKRLHIQCPLVVTDPGFVKTPAFTRLVDVLGSENKNASWFLYDQVHPNPIESDVSEPASLFTQYGCDGVIAIGGGSALDAGKACRLLVKRPNYPLENFYDESDWSRLPPLIAIPTTAGTGSEVGRSSVITLTSTGRKSVLFHPELLAKVVILDPEFTLELPPGLTAATGADALTHCIESFTCPAFHPMCDGIALEGIHQIIQALPRAVRDGSDVEARGIMLVAAAMGAVAFQKDLGAVHSLAHPLSTVCGLHHGLANALCLVAVMRHNSAKLPGLYRRVGIACGLNLATTSPHDADTHTIDFIETFLTEIGIRGPLRNHRVTDAHIDTLANHAWEDPCHKTNAVPVTRDDLRNLYLAVL